MRACVRACVGVRVRVRVCVEYCHITLTHLSSCRLLLIIIILDIGNTDISHKILIPIT